MSEKGGEGGRERQETRAMPVLYVPCTLVHFFGGLSQPFSLIMCAISIMYLPSLYFWLDSNACSCNTRQEHSNKHTRAHTVQDREDRVARANLPVDPPRPYDNLGPQPQSRWPLRDLRRSLQTQIDALSKPGGKFYADER